MSRAKVPKKEIRGRDKELKSYKDTLRDASLQYEDKVLELSLLRRVGDIVGYIIDPELFYRMFVDILLEETNAENCSSMIMDTETKTLALKMARGRNDEGKFFDHPVDSEVTFFLGEEVEKKVALERKTILIDDVSVDKCFAIKETHFPIGSLLCTPLIFQEEIFGVINLSHTQPYAFSQSNKRTMDLLCTFVSSIIGNAIDYIKVKDQGKFKSMFEGIRIPILLVDPKTNSIVGCNGYAEEWLGYSKKELIHTDHIFDIVPHEYRKKVECILNEIVEKNSSKFNEVSFIRKDSSVNIGEINGTMIDYQGRNIVQVTVKDVTERRKAERETKEDKEFMENVFKTSVDGIMVTDNKGSITLVNEAITKMLGYSKNELIGKRTGVFNPKGESYKKNVGKYLTLLFEEGTVTAFELTYLKKDRNLIDVEVNSALLRDNKGNIR